MQTFQEFNEGILDLLTKKGREKRGVEKAEKQEKEKKSEEEKAEIKKEGWGFGANIDPQLIQLLAQ